MKHLKTLLLGIYAGLAIGLGSFGYLLTRFFFPSTRGAILASFVFSVGLIIVCLCRFFLYTGKIGFFLDKREKIKENTINLPIMLVGNAIGAFGLGIVCYFIFYNVAGIKDLVTLVSINKTSSSSMLSEGILCGALVFFAVYLFINVENFFMKMIGIILPITLFVYCGFQHCIANMFYFGMAFNWNIDMLWNLLIVIFGNSVGALLARCMVHLSSVITTK